MNAALFPDLVVNGETVPHTVIAAEAQNHHAPSGKPGIAWRKAANAVAVRTLLFQEARKRGVSSTPAELEPGRFETNEEALIRGLLDIAVEASPPTEEMIRAEWDKDPSRFRAPPLWEVSHILIACDPRDQEETQAARTRADHVLAAVQATPRKFAHIAEEHSDCGSKSSGGALGQLGPHDTVPEFENVLRTLKDGDVTKAPVLTRHGWHIIRMDARAEGEILPYETMRPRIKDALEKAAWVENAQAFIAGLVDDAQISGADLRPVA